MQTSRAAKRRGRSNSIAGAKRMALIEAGLEPTPERLRHGPVVRQKRVLDEGAAVVRQGLDTISIMLARGSITLTMH